MDNKKEIKLDGTATHRDLVVPFDAHEQRTRGSHVPTAIDSPDITNVQEFPKAIDHIDGEPVIAVSAEHEVELKAAHAEQKEGK